MKNKFKLISSTSEANVYEVLLGENMFRLTISKNGELLSCDKKATAEISSANSRRIEFG